MRKLLSRLAVALAVLASSAWQVSSPAAADVAGPGYNLFRDSGLLPTGYTFRFVNTDDLRSYVQHSANSFTSITGLPTSVPSGTIDDRFAERGEILVYRAAILPLQCGEEAPACGIPHYDENGPKAGVEYVASGEVWIRTLPATTAEKQKLLSHEIGHALGLAHYETVYNGTYQIMKQGWNGISEYQDGDKNGFRYQKDKGWVEPPPPPSWHPWSSFSGQIVGDPDVASWASGRLDVFARDSNNTLIQRYFNGSSWSGWVSLGGTLASDPTAVSWGSGRIDVFARDANNTLIQKYFNGSSWSGWISQGGTLASAPDATSWGSGRIDVFAMGIGNTLVRKYFNGSSWSLWETIPGTISSGPSAVSWGPDRIDVFARGSDNTLQHLVYSGGLWGLWNSLGGTLTSAPDAASWGSGRIDVFARGTSNTLLHKWYSNGWSSGFDSLGGSLTSGPGAVSWGSGRIDVFARSSDGTMMQKWYG